MHDVPADLLSALSTEAAPIAELWWASLSDDQRQHIVGLWDNRWEVKFFAPQTDAAGQPDTWDELPQVQGGRFLPSDDDGRGEWSASYFEHLLNHPELLLAYEPERQRLLVLCTQHQAARACLAAGVVPTDFVCPLDERPCPMTALRGSFLTKMAPE